MCLLTKKRAAARQRAAAIAAGRPLVEKLPTPNKDERAPPGEYQVIRDAIHDETALRALCEKWAGNPVIDFYERSRGSTGSEVGNECALASACYFGNEAAARLLISAGADVNAINGSCSALTFALFTCHLPIVRLLIDEGADVNHLFMTSTPLDMVEQQRKRIGEGGTFQEPENLSAIVELLERAGGKRGGLLFLFCCWRFCF